MITNVIFVDRLIVDFSGQNKLLTYDTLGLDHIIICWGKLAIGVFKGEKGVVFELAWKLLFAWFAIGPGFDCKS